MFCFHSEKVIPPPLLGDAAATAGLRATVRLLVGLRRHQPLSLHTALRGMPLHGCPALLPHGARCVWNNASPSGLSPSRLWLRPRLSLTGHYLTWGSPQ